MFNSRNDLAVWLRLPAKRSAGRPLGARTQVPVTPAGEPGQSLLGTVGQFGAVSLEPVTSGADHGWWRELVGRYHYLGYRVPFGAQLRYLAFVSQPTRTVVAALQLSSPAWRLAARDLWIGWDEPTRVRNLQRVVNNSRFLVLPWVRVQNLASRLLALLAGRLATDWSARFATEPLLLETLVDGSRFAGTATGLRTGSSWATRRVGGVWIAPMPAMAKHRSGCWCILWWPTLSAGWRRPERWALRWLGRRSRLTCSPPVTRGSSRCCRWQAVRKRNG